MTTYTKEGDMARWILCFSVVLQACTSHAVRCDAHLQPINAPAAKSVPAVPAPAKAAQ
jgi:hypothetical protein